MKHVVITSIFAPTKAVMGFAAQPDTRVIVAGDKKSPTTYDCPGVKFLSCDDQARMGSALAELLPYNHYCRKMIGYIAAVRDGATVILDTDDDNIPIDGASLPAFGSGYAAMPPDRGFVNVYQLYSNHKIWPRGLPLRLINKSTASRAELTTSDAPVGIWQGLADGDPDVDAIYRLTDGSLVQFDRIGSVVLETGTVCPFNSQNTMFRRELFPLLYLPATVTFRYTDILRGLVAQPVLWAAGFRLGFHHATVVQERNEHDFTRDFESEVPMYLTVDKVLSLCTHAVSTDASVSENLRACYASLAESGIVADRELLMLDAWLRDLDAA